MNLDQLRTFLAVVERGSFSRAADAMGLGQSTVSFHVKALETSVGGRLLDRRAGRVRATAAGRLLRGYARRMLALRDEALSRLRAEDEGEVGHVTIAASTIPAEFLLPSHLAVLRRRHPGVDVTLLVSDSSGAAAVLLAERCDLAVVGARSRDRKLVQTPFAADEIVLVASARSPLGARRALRPDELARMPLILREEGSGSHQAVAPLLAALAGGGRALAPRMVVGSTTAARRCVLEGLGFSFLSRIAVREDLAQGRLRVVRFPGTPMRRTFYVARLGGVTLPAAAAALHALLVRKDR